MANVKISELPAATSVAATDVSPIVVGGVTQKATNSQIVTSALNATPVTVAQGGTGATTAAAARTALGLGSLATLNSPVPLANGGTGQTTAAAARTALLPAQTGNAGKALVSNGTDVVWGSTSPISSVATWTFSTAVQQFTIDIPATAVRMTINMIGVSYTQSNPGAIIQFEVDAAPLAAGYVGAYSAGGAYTAFTNGLIFSNNTGGAALNYGQVFINDCGSNKWMTQGQSFRTGDNAYVLQTCYVATANRPTKLIFTAGVAGTFDAGQVVVQFEG